MFGYIRFSPCGQDAGDCELYKKYYCGICRSLRSVFGFPFGAVLSYDSAFLALLLESLSPEPAGEEEIRCPLPPFRKKTAIKGPAVHFAAAANLFFFYQKLSDNCHDRNILWHFPRKIISPAYRKALSLLPQRGDSLDKAFATLYTLEKIPHLSPDERASSFGTILGELTGSFTGKTAVRGSLQRAGLHLGRWIYYIDALDDYKTDKKKGRYNPLFHLFPGRDSSGISELMKTALRSELFALSQEISSLPLKKNISLIQGLVFVGLEQMTTSILNKFNTTEVHDEKPLRRSGDLSGRRTGRSPKSLSGTCQKIPSGQTHR